MGRLENDPDMKVLYEKGKKKHKYQEAGWGKNGEPSVDALRRWFVWAGAALVICLVVVLTGAVLTSGKNRKEAAVLELDAGPVVELVLNRKGMILESGGKNGAGSLLVDGLPFDRSGLEQGMELLLDRLHESGAAEERGVILLTIRPYAKDNGINVSRMTDQAVLYAEKALKKRQAEAVIYYNTFQETSGLEELKDQQQISYGKAGLVKGLVDKNTKLRREDQARLAQMELREIEKEIESNKYAVAYESVTVKTSYKEKDEKDKEPKESAEAGTTEATTESTGESTEASESSEEETTEEKKETPAATKAPETTPAATAAPETTALETTATETAAPETAAPTPETSAPAPEIPAPEPATEAPTPVPPVPETVNPAGPGFNQEAPETVPEVKSPLEGPGA